jgi:hypothetical protein
LSESSSPTVQAPANYDGRTLSGLTWVGVALGAVGLVAGLVASPRADFYFSWLVAYLYFLSIALGALFFVMTLFACRAGWSVTLRRVIENVMATLPVFAVLFVPIWLGRHDLFVWTDAAKVAKDAALKGKSGYLNEGFFAVRAVIYFAAWGGLATYFSAQSQKQDQSGDERITRRLQAVSGPGLIVFSLTLTLAAVDWMMSLEPEWYSTMFGVYYFAGSLLSAFAFIVVAVAFIHARGQLRGIVTVEHVHDIGKLLFAFVVFWAYIAFCQYFLIWYGNMPEETAYFMHRSHGSWPTVARWLILGHFAIPFFFLMPRAVKRSGSLLVAGALWLLFMHFMDLYWCVIPVHREEGAHLQISDVTTMLAVGGFFLATLGWVSSRRALVPLRDPRLAESMSFENV